jgi:hypothetical protein
VGRSSPRPSRITLDSDDPDSVSSPAAPIASSTVGAMSTCLTAVAITIPLAAAATRGPMVATISGTRSVASYANMPWVISPCSPRLSPWSAVTITVVGLDSVESFSKREPSAKSVHATSPSYGCAVYLAAYSSGGLYGRCGSNTCTHAKNRPFCRPIQSTARDTTTSARRSGIVNVMSLRISGI